MNISDKFLDACALVYGNTGFYFEFVGYDKDEAFRVLDEYAALWDSLPAHVENVNLFIAPIGPRDKQGCILSFRKDVCARLEKAWAKSLSKEEANALIQVLESTPGIKQQIEIQGDLVLSLEQIRSLLKQN